MLCVSLCCPSSQLRLGRAECSCYLVVSMIIFPKKTSFVFKGRGEWALAISPLMFMHKFRLYSAVHIHMHGCGLICWPNPPTISVSVGVWYFDTKSRQCFVWSIQLKTKPVTKKSVKHSSFLAFLKHPLLCAKFGSSIKTRNKRLKKNNSAKLVLVKLSPLKLWDALCPVREEGKEI